MKAYFLNVLGLILLLCSAPTCAKQEIHPVVNNEADPKLYFVRGYRSENDPCKLTGETEFTNQFLDDAADLVTCLSDYEGTAEFMESTRAKVVSQTKSYTLYSVPRR